MKQRERFPEGEKMKLRNSVLHQEARRKKRVTREKRRKAVPIHCKCWWKESGGRVPRGAEAEQETDVGTRLCRLQQTKWEIRIIPDYLTRNILKMMSGRLELWNRKVSHFLATRTEETSVALFPITADGSHSAHSEKCLIFPSQTTLGPKHADALLKEVASPLPPQMNGAYWWQKEESSFQHGGTSHSIRTPREKRNIWALPCPWGYLLSSLLLLRELPQYLGSSCTLGRTGGKGWCWPRSQKKRCNLGQRWGVCGGNKSSSDQLWRLVWLMALFDWLCIRMFPSHHPCCMKSKKHKRDRKVGREVFCKVKIISQSWFKPLLITYSKKPHHY